MKVLLLIISLFPTLPLIANEQLKQLHQTTHQLLLNREYHATIAHAEELLKMSKAQDDIWYTVQSYFILGYSYKKNEDFGKAVLCYLEGARFAERSSNNKVKESLISIYKNLANIMGDYKHFDLAHRFNQKGLEVAYEISNERHIVHLLQNDGYEYVEEERYDLALQALQTIFNNYKPEFERKISLTNDLGIVYRNLGKSDEAIYQYQSILDLRDSIQDNNFIAKVFHNLGLALMDKQEYEKALAYFEESEEINLSQGFSNNLFMNYKYIGLSLYEIGRKNETIAYFLKAAAIFDETYVEPEHFDIFKLIAEYYFSDNQLKLGLDYEKLYIKHLETYIARQKEIEELDKKYNIELVTQRYFDLLEAEERHQQAVLRTQIALGSTTAISLFVLFYVLYRQHRKRREAIEAIRYIQKHSKM